MPLDALYSAATGMLAQQTSLDNISNNLANVNTAGFKRGRASFADLLYTELRATKLHGADLSDALFLTQSQIETAEGDASTVLSAPLRAPVHWTH